jgi:hypothetical protein
LPFSTTCFRFFLSLARTSTRLVACLVEWPTNSLLRGLSTWLPHPYQAEVDYL